MYELLGFPARLDFGSSVNGVVSIGILEQTFIRLLQKNFPTFPLGFSTGDAGSVRMDSALFCITGHQYFKATGYTQGGPQGSASFYTIVSPSSLAILAAYDLKPWGSLFVRHGFPPSYSLNFHQLRHFTNTVADQSGIPNEIITAWSGRKSRNQTNEYIHTSHADRAEKVRAVQTPQEDFSGSIRLISKEQVSQQLNLPASITSTGICTQNLISNPCEFLNDFVSTCFLCPSACYTAGDTDALEILNRDLEVQSRRLEAVKRDRDCQFRRSCRSGFLPIGRIPGS
jgi:hypothetical protein